MNLVKMLKDEPIMFIIIGLLFRDFAGYAMLFMPGSLWIVSDIIGFVLIIVCLFFSHKQKLEGTVSKVFDFFILWTVFMILRGSLVGNFPLGEPQNIQGAIHFMVSSPMSTLGYIIPIIALIPFSVKSLKKFKTIVLIIVPISLFLTYSHIDSIMFAQSSAQYQGYTDLEWRGGPISMRTMIGAFFPVFELVIFMLFCYSYLKTRLKLFIPIGVVVYLIGLSIGGGRGGSILAFGYLIVWLFVLFKYPYEEYNVLRYSKKNNINTNRLFVIVLVAFLIYGFYYLIVNTEIFDFLFYRIFGDSSRNSIFVENNRSEMTHELIKDFNSSPLSWFIGRGINGYYVSHSEYSDGGYRAWMEWGYLYLILKGGIVYLCLYIYLFLHAANKGFFHSKNILCKAMALICLFQVINLASTDSEPSLLSSYVIPWYCLGALERRRIRELDDTTIYNFFNFKHQILKSRIQ